MIFKITKYERFSKDFYEYFKNKSHYKDIFKIKKRSVFEYAFLLIDASFN